MHRIFKQGYGRTLHETIKSIRLQKAANLLLTNRDSNIGEISQMCGYSSQTSFSQAFKECFHYSPKAWRLGGYEEHAEKILGESPFFKTATPNLENLEPEIIKIKPMRAVYIRHRGYDKSIKKTWQRLKAWSEQEGISGREIGLHHDNPVITPLKECSYVAAIEVPDDFKTKSSLSLFEIPSSICAKFSLDGKYGDVLKLIHYIYHSWIVGSGYEAKTLPPYAIYRKNHFLSTDEEFSLDFYLPVTVI